MPTRAASGGLRSFVSAILALSMLVMASSQVSADSVGPGVTGPVLSATSVIQGQPVLVSTAATDPSGVVSTEVRIDGGAWSTLQPNAGDVSTSRTGSGLINVAFSSVAAGGSFTCARTVGGGIRCWGDNTSGQLGDGSTTSSTFPVAVVGISTAIGLDSGGSYSCAVLSDKTVRCWGANGVGQLGNGATTNSATPVTVSGITNALSVDAGANHSCAVLADKTVRCWGDNGFGQLGDGTTTQRSTPVAVAGISTAIAVTAGGSHSCALLDGGAIRCWGYNAFGQLGDGTTNPGMAPVSVSGITTATAISAGGSHTCARLSTGGMRCWGRGASGQLGDGFLLNRTTPVTVPGISAATSISAGDAHTCARLGGGPITCWGQNGSGQLGDGTTDSATPLTVTSLASAVAVSAGSSDTCARLTDSSVRCWGDNGSGKLGYSSPPPWSTTPIKVPGLTSAAGLGAGTTSMCAVRSVGTITCWGDRGPVTNSGLTSAIAVSAGDTFQCALISGGTVRCWGFARHGLGDGATTDSDAPVTVYGITTATAIAVGTEHACARLEAGGVKCWGSNAHGMLGDGSTLDRSAPVSVVGLANAVSISAGEEHTCAVLTDQSVKCWGANRYGQLGNGSTTDSVIPVPVSGISTAAEVSAGAVHSCARLIDHSVMCWGDNSYEQLGRSNFGTGNSSTPLAVPGIATASGLGDSFLNTCAVLADNTVRCWGLNQHGELGDGTTARRNAPVTVLGIDTATAVAAGGNDFPVGHSCAILAGGIVKCWGDDEWTQLGSAIGATFQGRRPPDSVMGTLAAGAHQVCVRATDAAGNTSAGTTCASLTVLDRTAPTVTAPTVTLRTGVSLTGTSLRTTIAWTGADNAGGAGIARYELARSVDGGATWTSLGTSLTANSYPLTVASTGTVRYRVRAVDAAANVGAWTSGPDLQPRLIQGTSAEITYGGTWGTTTATSYSGGSTRFASVAGASASYTFTGRSIALVTTQATSRGSVKVYVDGVLSTTLSTYASATAFQVQAWAKSWPSAATHTLKLVVVGTSGHPRIDLDALAVIQGTATAPPTTGSGGPPEGGQQPAEGGQLPNTSIAQTTVASSAAESLTMIGVLVLMSGLLLACAQQRAHRRARRCHPTAIRPDRLERESWS